MAAEYPHTDSTRYPQSSRDALRAGVPADTIGGIYRTGEGDIRTWLIDAHVVAGHRDVRTALAYLDIADGRAKELAASVGATRTSVDQLAESVRQLTLALQDQERRLAALIGLTAAEIPAWANRDEVEQGDDMGLIHPSAESLGLVIEYVEVRQEPGFSHHDVVALDPPAGTVVPRGSTVRVTINLEG